MDDSNLQLAASIPLFAILRGVTPSESADVAKAIVAGGFEIIEVTMNSSAPLDSVAAIHEACGSDILLGVGTVTGVDQVEAAEKAGARLVVSPNFSSAVVAAATSRKMAALPGVMTPTEMFAALEAGASGLKIFPAELVTPAVIRAVRAVLPPETPIYVVGGINAGNMKEYLQAGATGFGFGGSVYKPGKPLADIERDARSLVKAYQEARVAA